MITIYLVGESRRHAGESSPPFDVIESAMNYAEDNAELGYKVYGVRAYFNIDEMYEIEINDEENDR